MPQKRILGDVASKTPKLVADGWFNDLDRKRTPGPFLADHASSGSGMSTTSVHAGTHDDPRTGAVGTPIYQASTFVLNDDQYQSVEEGFDYDSQGMVDRALLEDLLPDIDCDFYLCGPGPFMQAMYDLLHEMGVATDRISYEFFGPASVLKPKNGVAPTPKSTVSSDQPKVIFANQGLKPIGIQPLKTFWNLQKTTM